MDDSEAAGAEQHPPSVTTHRLRWWSRCLMLLGTILLLTLGRDTLWPVVVPALSPFVALASALVTRSWPWFSWIGLVVLALVAWRQRWFCRWLCPMGFCADQATWLGRRCGRQRGPWPAVGQWIALLTLAGACVGYPLLLWLDPLALLSAAVSTLLPGGRSTAWWLAGGLAAVLVVSFLWPHSWCGRLCPLGGTQEAVFSLSKSMRLLVAHDREERRKRASLGGIRRRSVLGAVFGVVWATASLRARRGAAAPLRPPGAVPEARFSGLCLRCGNCSRACPTDIISPDISGPGIAGLLTPRLSFHEDYCLETCNLCTLVCPSGALQPVLLDSKVHTPLGTPVVDMDICLLGDDRECSHCRNHCPYEAIRLEFSEEFYTLTPLVNLELCPGCGACQVACPTQPDKAIVVRPGR